MRRNIKNTALFSSSVSLMSYMMVSKAVAATAEYCTKESNDFLGLPTWYKYLNPEFDGDKCELNAKFPEDLGKIGLALVEILLRVGGMVAVAFVIYGGFKYLTSQGEPDNTKNARQTILNAVIGLVIAILATAIVSFIGAEATK